MSEFFTHDPAVARFWSRVSIPLGRNWREKCWEWRGAITRGSNNGREGGHNGGYGAITVDGVTHRAHRWIFEQTVGDIYGGALVLHSCDNRKCVNPAHLSIGTHSENLRDQWERGRR